MINEFKKFAFLTNTRVDGKGRREGVGSEKKGRWKPRGCWRRVNHEAGGLGEETPGMEGHRKDAHRSWGRQLNQSWRQARKSHRGLAVDPNSCAQGGFGQLK